MAPVMNIPAESLPPNPTRVIMLGSSTAATLALCWKELGAYREAALMTPSAFWKCSAPSKCLRSSDVLTP